MFYGDNTVNAVFLYYLLMWEKYREFASRYPRLLLDEERRLIARAQAGRKNSRDELVFRHIGFVMWRLRKKIFPLHLARHGEDMLAAAIPVLYQKIQTYDLDYRDRRNKPKPVRFASYIWKRIDGFAVDYIKNENSDRPPGEFVNRKSWRRAARNRLLCGESLCVL